MATSEILVFAEGPGANIEAQAAYAADPLRTSGNIPGVAKSALNNKALLQSSLMASALAKFMADNQANNIVDTATIANLVSWLGDALRGALGVTPPQFDNDLSLATTEFVQRALGNFSAALTYAAGGSPSLLASHAGRQITLTGTTSGVLYLPPLSSVPDGAAFLVKVEGQPNAWTIANAGVDGAGIVVDNSAVANTGALAQGAWVLLVKGAGLWRTHGNINGMQASLATNGYQKLPSGLIIQWGLTAATTTSTPITFPITFPNALIHVNEATYGPTLSYPATKSLFNFFNVTLSGMTAVNSGSVSQASAGAAPTLSPPSSGGCLWLAIGY